MTIHVYASHTCHDVIIDIHDVINMTEHKKCDILLQTYMIKTQHKKILRQVTKTRTSSYVAYILTQWKFKLYIGYVLFFLYVIFIGKVYKLKKLKN